MDVQSHATAKLLPGDFLGNRAGNYQLQITNYKTMHCHPNFMDHTWRNNPYSQRLLRCAWDGPFRGGNKSGGSPSSLNGQFEPATASAGLAYFLLSRMTAYYSEMERSKTAN